MSLEWLQLRPWNGSQQTAFEKLCLQLLGREPVEPGSTFVPKSAPDAGVEGYWRLGSGAEWGLQAKFFLSALGDSQWNQLDKSVARALDCHPKLARYTVAIPQDQSDPRIPNQQWFADKWSARVELWSKWAKERNMNLSFEYWGETDLLDRLTKDVNRGLVLFWFNKHTLSTDWMFARVTETIGNVGPRYTPDLNVDLPVAFTFEGLGKTRAFYEELGRYRTQLRQELRKAVRGPATETVSAKWDTLTLRVEEVCNELLSHVDHAAKVAPFGVISQAAESANELVWSCLEAVQAFEATKAKEKAVEVRNVGSMFDYELHWLRELAGTLNALRGFLHSDAAACYEAKTLVLVGGAGVGKTHLFCDVALHRLQEGLPTLLILGTHFEDGEPLAQIPTRILGMQLSRDDFLAALDAAGEAAGVPALLMVDALNEGEGRLLWLNFLGGTLEALRRYRHIALAISVRDSYTDIIIPEGLGESALPQVWHSGFAGHEYVATRTFFDYYGLKAPSIPLLNPEFDNPQFLKLFCKSLVNLGRTEVPRGIAGLTAIFDNFLDSVNTKLSKPQALDFDPSDRLVQRAVDLLVDEMNATGRPDVARTVARTKVNELLPHRTGSQSLYAHLKSEDVIYEDRLYGTINSINDVVRLSFERFADHASAKRLLERISSPEELNQEFTSGRLGSLVSGQWRMAAHAGLIEALAIQVPAKFADELLSICPVLKSSRAVASAFLRTIPWRDPASINDKTREILNELFYERYITEREILRMLLLVAASPEHPWNADFLHKNLIRREMPVRDATWSIFVFRDYEEEDSPTNRLITWASGEPQTGRFDKESVRLAAITLCWMLSTSHRFARDRATKALVALLSPYPAILVQILTSFESVDDPYVQERLYCVAYGCAMRLTETDGLCILAQKVYSTVFDKDDMPAHLLLRDYARGVVEVAHIRGVSLPFDLSRTRPPYGSNFQVPVFARGELEQWSGSAGEGREGNWAKRHIYHSVMGQDDFARYVIGTNSGSFEWSKHSLQKTKRLRPKNDRHWEDRFDLRLAQQWIMRRVIDLGWKTELFGEFDSRVSSEGRSERKPERTGKKYQWIAYHEFLARVADNFEFTGDGWAKRTERYDGPWQAGFVRDIDPSCLLQKTKRDATIRCWWQPLDYAWDAIPTHEEWLSKTDDLPKFDSGLLVVDTDSQQWCVLESYYHFDQPRMLAHDEEREMSLPERQIWTQVRSYLVRERDFGRLSRWAEKQDFMGRWMPESHDAGRLFLGEYYLVAGVRIFRTTVLRKARLDASSQR